MKSSAKSFHKKLLILLCCVVAVALVVITALTTVSYKKSFKEFGRAGYILVPSDNAALTTDVNEMHYFSEGTSYREKITGMISFKDTSNKDVKIDKEQFVHFTDGSLKSFTNGVVMSLTEVDEKQVSYFGVSNKTTIVKNATQYEMSYLGDMMQIQEFVWKIADDTYMVVAPQITVHLSKDKEVTLNDYVQVKYVDGEIVRLVHEQGTYQTVSSDAYLLTDGGVELGLVSKCFMVDGKEGLSLDSMIIDSDANLAVDENEDQLKLPTFNVVNGADGSNGENGANGEDGDKGQSGEVGADGSSGNKGSGGGNGQNGQSGIDGTDGVDGEEGEQGDLGYDGKDGAYGNDAPSSESPDGVGSIEQPNAPTVSIITDQYNVGANSADIWLDIKDEDGLLTDNLKWTIYTRDGYDYVAGYDKQFHSEEGLIGRTTTKHQVVTNKLQPDTEYVLIVSGTYATEYGEFTQDFLTKIFSTDKLGINISKIQVASDKIVVKVNMADDSQVGTYGIALYRESDLANPINLKTLWTGNKGTKEFVFSNEENLQNNQSLYPDSNYVITICNVTSKNSSDTLPIDIRLDVSTLKVTPYYLDANNNVIAVSDMVTKIIPSDRYKTVTLSLENGIKDPHNGIAGYRYELYETSSVTAGDGKFVDAKEVDSLQNVTFDVDPAKSYYGRVIVLFKDNEKTVELASNNSPVATLLDKIYPVTNIVINSVGYDYIEGTIVIEDKNRMIIDHISNSYPLNMLIIGEDGNVEGISIVKEEKKEPESDKVYYYFRQDGLKRNTTYSISVSGTVNTTNSKWDDLTQTEKEACGDYYLAGLNVTTPDPVTMKANFDASNVTSGANAFEISFSISSSAVNEDPSYEVGNLEIVKFALFDSNHNQIGQEYVVKDMDYDEQKHESDFQSIYNKDTASYNQRFVLTDDSFKVAGDSRIVGGGDFYIKLIDSADYTSNDTEYPYFTNKMNWDLNSTEFGFSVTRKHAYSNDVNAAVTVEQIKNVDAEGKFSDDSLEDDTVVGLKLTPDYSWEDAKTVIYYVYKVNLRTDEPLVAEKTTLYPSNWKYEVNGKPGDVDIVPVGTKTFVLSDGTYGKNVPPWTVYFNDVSNMADDGTTKLFERGYSYFVRYEVKCDGTIGGEIDYPACLYESDPPFYRSQVFNVLRQVPSLHRYLWSTSKVDSTWNHVWKYIVNDPDNAIFAENAAPEALIYQPGNNYDKALETLDDALTERKKHATTVSLANLYTATQDGNQWKTEYQTLTFTGLKPDYYYNVELDYRLCDYENSWYNATTDTLSSKFYHVDDVTGVNTESEKTNTDLTHWEDRKDYHVSGVLVKGIGLEKGVVEEGGYRIKLTIQGDEVDRIAALKVILTDASDSSKSVIYDPVSIQVVTENAVGGEDASGNDVTNNYANAYLSYEPLVAAAMTDKDVKVQVYAYCRTGNKGLESYVEYDKYQDPATSIFTAESAWAIKGVTYQDGYEYVEQSYFISKADDGTVSLKGSPLMKKVKGIEGESYPTVQNSLMLPQMMQVDSVLKNVGFSIVPDTIDVGQLNMVYTGEPLAMFVNSPSTINNFIGNALTQMYALANGQLPVHQLLCMIDENGLSDMADRYLTVEKLKIKPMMLDFGNAADNAADNYYIGDIKTGSGLPAISQNINSTSVGRSSATLVFDTKGTFPDTDTDKYNDKTIYIELYEVNGTQEPVEVPLKKYCYEDEGVKHYFYATSNYGLSEFEKECTGAESKGTAIVYGEEGTDGRLEIVVRGLKPSTETQTQKYHVLVYALNNANEKQYLFDYTEEQTKYKYDFRTAGNIKITVIQPVWQKPSYSGKNGQFRFAVEGSEGTNMTIFFKIYDMNGTEIKPGSSNSSYITSGGTGYGYKVAPLGTKIQYYDSDPSTNKPMEAYLKPGGVLKLDTKYKIEVTAYETYNGVIDYTSKLGQTTIEFNTPQSFVKPRASVRIDQGETSIKATINMTDEDRVIYNDTYTVTLYDTKGNIARDVNGNPVEPQTVTLDNLSTNKAMSKTVEFKNLSENAAYILRLEAPLDQEYNDGVEDARPYVKEINTSTISQAEASVVYEFTSAGSLVFTLRNCINFKDVSSIMYSIYSEDAKEFYTSKEVELSVWDATTEGNGTAYSYEVADWEPFVGVTYSYVIQYYDKDGNLLGTTNGFFKKS